MNFLAFDLGASSGRGILGILKDGKLELQEIHRFPNGHKTVDGELFWDYPALVNELKEGLKKALAITKDIAAIGVDTWGVDYVLFDKDTKAMKRLPYHYRDTRTEKYVDEIWNKVSRDEIYSRTGIQFMPFNTLYQLYAHKAEHPEDFENAQFLHMPDALAFALGGNFETEYTIANATFTTPGPETPTLIAHSGSPIPQKAPAINGLSSTAFAKTTSLAQPNPS